ncbi:hypothetical protein ACVW1C_002298 [Bradyrhizobium sp. USDA 4011]
MRSVLLGCLLASVAGVAVAQDWGNIAVISATLGNNSNRLCIGDHSRSGDIGCPTYAPSLTTAGDVSVSGNLSANKFIGDGSGLTNVGAASTDRIVSGTTSMLAISSTSYISLTQAGTSTGWFDPTRGLVTIGVSSTGGISATTGFFSGDIQFGTGINKFFSARDSSNYLQLHNGAGVLSLSAKVDQVFITSGTEAMRIVSSGYVGIGTTAPTYQLDVSTSVNGSAGVNIGNYSSGAAAAATLHLYNGANRLQIVQNGINNANTGAYRASMSTFAGTAGGINFAGSGPNGVLGFYTGGVSTTNERLRIISTGLVGINTTTPTTALEVNGTVSATRFIGDGSGLTNVGAASTDRIYLWHHQHAGDFQHGLHIYHPGWHQHRLVRSITWPRHYRPLQHRAD